MGSRSAYWKKRKAVQGHSGTVYVLRIRIGEVWVWKVGVTVKTVARRVLQIIEGFQKVYGYFPEVQIVHEEKTRNHFKCESAIHGILCDSRYVSEYAFTGSTELFGSGLEKVELLEAYRLAIDSDEPAEVRDTIAVW